MDYRQKKKKAFNDKIVNLRSQIEDEILVAAKEFDAKVNEIMNKYGFTK